MILAWDRETSHYEYIAGFGTLDTSADEHLVHVPLWDPIEDSISDLLETLPFEYTWWTA
jgi:hypothetical protein